MEEYAAASQLAESTLNLYLHNIRVFRQWVEETVYAETPADVTREHVRAFIYHTLLELGYSRSASAVRLAALRSYFRWARRRKMVAHDPTQMVSVVLKGFRLPRIARQSELDDILDYPPEEVQADPPLRRLRDDLLLELMYGSGLRAVEVCSLRASDILPDKGRMRLERAGKVVELPMTEISVKVFEEYVGRCPPEQVDSTEPLFLNQRGNQMTPRDVYRILNRRTNRNMGTSELRNKCAVDMLDGGADTRIVQEMLGHQALTTTMRYRKASPKDLREMVEKYHPRH